MSILAEEPVASGFQSECPTPESPVILTGRHTFEKIPPCLFQHGGEEKVIFITKLFLVDPQAAAFRDQIAEI